LQKYPARVIFSTRFAEAFVQCFNLERNISFYFRINRKGEAEGFTVGLPVY